VARFHESIFQVGTGDWNKILRRSGGPTFSTELLTFATFVHRLAAFKTGHEFDRCNAHYQEGFTANPANPAKKGGLCRAALLHNSKTIEC
jgi:hypothetical protein